MQIGKYRLEETCGGCPEAYNVYIKNDDGNDQYVAYFRLRYGTFTVSTFVGTKNGNETTVHKAYPEGDGCFEMDERERFLGDGIMALDRYLNPPETPAVVAPTYAAEELTKLRQWLHARPDYVSADGDESDSDAIIRYVEARI